MTRTSPASPALDFTVNRTIPAPRAQVYAAWTRPEAVPRWFAAFGVGVTKADMDVRVGGGFRFEVRGAGESGPSLIITGAYRELVPGRKLAFTWNAKAGEVETLVTVELADGAQGATELRLRQAGFADQAVWERNRMGWDAILDTLASHYTKTLTIAAPPEKVLAALATLPGLAAWWTAQVEGNAAAGGEIRFTYGKSGGTRMRVERADASGVLWECVAITVPGLDEWTGTRQEFALRPLEGGRTELTFRHIGLTPATGCYGQCRPGWERYLASLQAYVETGAGWPIAA